MTYQKIIGDLAGAANGVGTLVNQTEGAIGRVQSLVGGGTAGKTLQDYLGNLQQASFRGVPFAVLTGESRFGRRIALHEYPFRDKPWAEDTGRATRKFSIQGFLITKSAVYGGGDVMDQRNALVAAVETAGPGTLVHPTLGRLTVSIPEDGLVVREGDGVLRYYEITLACIENGDRLFPSADTNTPDATNAAADGADVANSTDFVSDVTDALQDGASVVQMVTRTATSWVNTVERLAASATSIFNMLVDLPGEFGRYFPGATFGYASTPSPFGSTATVDSLIIAGTAERGVVSSACGQLVATTAKGVPADIAAAATAVSAALYSATANPADAITTFAELASFYPALTTSPSISGLAEAMVQTATGALLRRSALAALARASAAYQPSSADDAANIRDIVADALESEIDIAGDSGDDATFLALRTLRAAVIKDLNTRGGSLPEMVTVQVQANLPSIVLAQRLYQDPSRADQLVTEADRPHPAFMPMKFKALAS